MRRFLQATAVFLAAAALFTACGSGSRGPKYFIDRTTDYVKFIDYPADGLHHNGVGERTFTADGFTFQMNTHAELDYSVGSDQLGEMTEKLGSQLTEAYLWRLENNEYHEGVSSQSAGMEKLMDLPVYHASFGYTNTLAATGTPMVADLYLLAYDESLCVLQFLYENGVETHTDRIKQILGGMAISELYSASPTEYGYPWQENYKRPTFDYAAGLLNQDPGTGLRVDGKIGGVYQSGGREYLELYDHLGYYWAVEVPVNFTAPFLGELVSTFSAEQTFGMPITVFGTLSSIGTSNSAAFEQGPGYYITGDYLITREDKKLFELK